MTTVDALATRTPRRFYVAMAIAVATVVLVGFAPSFYLKSVIQAPPPLSALTIIHGVVFTGWLAVFLAQTSLVAAGRTDLHRMLGLAGVVLAAGMVILGAYTAIEGARLGHAPPEAPPPLQFLAIPLFGIASFAALIATAVINRHRSETHKRLMVLASISITEPAWARLAIVGGVPGIAPFIAFGGADLMILAAIAYDYSVNRKVHPAYLYGAAFVLAVQVISLLAVNSTLWGSFAQWITS